MCLVTSPSSAPLPLRTAYVPRTVNHPDSVFNQLYGRNAGKVLQLPPPRLSEATMQVMRRTGLAEIWERAQGSGGLARLLADAEDEEYGGPSPVPAASAGVQKGQPIEDVVLAIAYREPGLGPTAISRHPAWAKVAAGDEAPHLSTVDRAGRKLEKGVLLTREGGYRVTEKGRPRAAALAKTLFGDPVAEEKAQERAAEEQG
jgi:hypothetical protein